MADTNHSTHLKHPQNGRVFVWTKTLADLGAMIPCNADGTPVPYTPPPGDREVLAAGLRKIPEVASLGPEKTDQLLDALCECTAYARLPINYAKLRANWKKKEPVRNPALRWGAGKPGRRPDVESYVLMADVQRALLGAGINPTAWNDGLDPGRLPTLESTLFMVFRVAAELAGKDAPVNLKPLVKNSGSIQHGERKDCKWKPAKTVFDVPTA